MGNMFKSKSFWIVAIVVIAAILLVYSNTGKVFVGETDILVLPKSDLVGRNAEQIIQDAKEIPTFLAFYDKLVEKNSDIEDTFAQLPDNQRKDMWNAELQVERKGASGVLAIKVRNASQLQAQILSQQTAGDIAVVMGRYYNMQDELDIRVVDGPIVGQVGRAIGFSLILLSVVLGLLAGAIVASLANMKRERDFSVPMPKMNFPSFDLGKKLDKIKKDELKIKDEGIIFPVAEKKPVSVEKKAAAPENLPIGSEFVISSLKRVEKSAKKEAAPEEAPVAKTHEATDEEIRQRLNKLLGGGM
jgi:hypothetical protein